jgi:hypothetical protein
MCGAGKKQDFVPVYNQRLWHLRLFFIFFEIYVKFYIYLLCAIKV